MPTATASPKRYVPIAEPEGWRRIAGVGSRLLVTPEHMLMTPAYLGHPH